MPRIANRAIHPSLRPFSEGFGAVAERYRMMLAMRSHIRAMTLSICPVSTGSEALNRNAPRRAMAVARMAAHTAMRPNWSAFFSPCMIPSSSSPSAACL